MMNKYRKDAFAQGFTLESSFSIEEIEANFQNIDLFFGIMEGLREALAYQQGEALEETVVHVVEE